jgi:hypothetical protein
MKRASEWRITYFKLNLESFYFQNIECFGAEI